MLTDLSIRNIVLIESLDIEFDKGLCVLTGETGAGKSILLDALGFVLGERASANLLQHGKDQGSVTAVFTMPQNGQTEALLQEQDIAIEENLILRRTINAEGRTKAFINQTPVNAGFLKLLGQQLVEVHGQHDQGLLLQQKYHRSLLDQFANHQELQTKAASGFAIFLECQQRLQQMQELHLKAEEEKDFIAHTVKELSNLNPKEGEEETLDQKRQGLLEREKSIAAIRDAHCILVEGASIEDKMRNAQTVLIRSQAKNPELEKLAERIEHMAIEADDVTQQLHSLLVSLEGDEEPLEFIEERLFALRGIARKHKVTVDELPAFYEKMQQELSLLEDHESHLAKLEAELEKAQQEFLSQAQKLSDSRKRAAVEFENQLRDGLLPLKMERTQFKVEIEALEEYGWGAHGMDRITFAASTNPGQPLQPIAKIASGGELSRFMLALKVVMHGTSGVPCLVFDEIDTGVGGAVADAIGERLRLVSDDAQVLVVTHQPQVAAKGHQHLRVEKHAGADNTRTNVVALDANARKEEIARMLAGAEVTDQAKAAAERLMQAEVA